MSRFLTRRKASALEKRKEHCCLGCSGCKGRTRISLETTPLTIWRFLLSGTQIISGDRNGDFRTWDAITGEAIVTVPSKRHAVGSLAVAYSSSMKVLGLISHLTASG